MEIYGTGQLKQFVAASAIASKTPNYNNPEYRKGRKKALSALEVVFYTNSGLWDTEGVKNVLLAIGKANQDTNRSIEYNKGFEHILETIATFVGINISAGVESLQVFAVPLQRLPQPESCTDSE